MMARTLRSECPVMVAISASVHPANASRVTAVPLKSWNVTPTTPAFLQALPHDARNPSAVHGLPSLFVQNNRAAFLGGIERRLERESYADNNTCAAFALPQANVFAVIGGPWQAQQVALPLSGP